MRRGGPDGLGREGPLRAIGRFLRGMFGRDTPEVEMAPIRAVPPSARRPSFAVDTTATPGASGNRAWANLNRTPLMTDTLTGISRSLAPGVRATTKGQPGQISNFVGTYSPEDHLIEVEAELPAAVRLGMIGGVSDPESEMRRVLAHEMGHATGHRGEVDADAFAAVLGALGASGDSAGFTPVDVGRMAYDAENSRRSTLRETGSPTNAYARPLRRDDRESFENIARMLLRRVPLYRSHPAGGGG